MAEVKTTEEYDGTNWSAGNDANTAGGEYNNLAGTQTSALCNGGYVGSYINESESYDGTNWSTSPANLAANQAHGSATAASTSAYLLAGGATTSNYQTSYLFDGSSWASSVALVRIRFVGNLLGTTTDANFNGGNRFDDDDSDEWNGSTWISGPTMQDNTSRYAPNNATNCGGTKGSAVLGGGTGTAIDSATNTIRHLD